MDFKPETAWVEAARKAADETYAALAGMEAIVLNIVEIDHADERARNSADQPFLDYLASGGHLDDTFLANAS